MKFFKLPPIERELVDSIIEGINSRRDTNMNPMDREDALNNWVSLVENKIRLEEEIRSREEQAE